MPLPGQLLFSSCHILCGPRPATTNNTSRYVARFGDTSSVAAGNGGGIMFQGVYTGTTLVDSGGIQSYKDNATSGDYAYSMTFATRANGGNLTERMRIDSSGNVGIGTASPSVKLQTNVSRTSGTNVTALVLSDTVTGAQTTGYGTQIQGWSNAGSAVSAIGFEASGGTNNDTAIAFYTQSTAAALTRRMTIDAAGSLILAGSTAQKATGTTWSNPSDQRLKDNIRDYAKGTTELMQVRVREWEYNGKGGTTEGMKGLGVIADEVITVLPDTVENYNAKLNADDEQTTAIKKFDATEITWLLVKTVQEQQAIITQLQADVAALKGNP